MKTLKKAICLAIALIMLCMTACSAQKEPENLARTVEVPYGEGTATFEFNEKGLLVAEEGKPWFDRNVYYTYDEENKITEIFLDDVDGNNWENDVKYVFEYYSDGKLKRETTYEMPFNTPIEYKEYIYDNDRIEKINTYSYCFEKIETDIGAINTDRGEIIFSNSEEFIYTEVENGLEINHKHIEHDFFFDYENSVCEIYTAGEGFDTYDKDGRLILEEYSAGDMEYVYDENGLLIKELVNEGEIVYEYEYENGLPVKKVCVKDEFSDAYNKKGKYVEYKYFDNGNIKVSSRYEKDGNLEDNDACVIIEVSDELKGNFSDIDYHLNAF